MSDGVALVHDGFALLLTIAIPLVAAAVVGVLLAVLATRALGIADPAVGAVARALAVFAALAVFGATWATQLHDFTATAWSQLAALGRGP